MDGAKEVSVSKKISVRKLIRDQGILFSVILLAIVLSILTPVFFTTRNVMNLLVNSTITLVLALGTTFVMLTGGIDLSIGSNLALSSAVGTGLIVYNGWPVFSGILMAIGISLLIGLVNGAVVAKLRMPSLIATLAMMSMARGLVFVYTNGANVYPVPVFFSNLGTGKVGSIPNLLIIAAVLSVICFFILRYTRFGRFIYAIGGNRLAAFFSGTNVPRIEMLAYVLNGLFAGVAGVLLTARLESAGPRAGVGTELTVIAAVVIGGTSLAGGEGDVKGTILGVLLISMVDNAINLLMVPAAYNDFFRGAVIFIAAAVDVYRRLLK